MKTNETKKELRGERACDFSITPEFPSNMEIELTNTCNHKCITCYIHKRQKHRPVIMPLEKACDLMKQGYELGAREIGFYGLSEPFMSKNLEECILFAKKLGFTYIYLTTNGSLITEERLRKAYLNGLDSLRFSINAGNAETYKKFHGHDDFEKVIKNVFLADSLRKELNLDINLFVSFVQTKINEGEFVTLQSIIKGAVDKMYQFEAYNGGGRLYEEMKAGIVRPIRKRDLCFLNDMETPTCPQPFNRFQVNAQGFLQICCTSTEDNSLVVADLNKVTLREAWRCDEFKSIRKALLEDKIPENCRCYNCMNNANNPVEPLCQWVKSL